MFSKQEIINGIRCETCSEKRIFGRIPNDSPDNLYVYTDFGGTTRCFCKDHMSYLHEDYSKPLFGAVLISELKK